MPPAQTLLYAALALISTTFAAVNGPCSIDGTPGVCIPSSKCTESGGTNRVGFCRDDPSDIKCCTKPSCGDGGNCRWIADCTGTSQSGLCPGPADFKCCLAGPPPDGPPPPPPPPPPPGGATPLDISPNGVAFIAGYEGFRPDFYSDPGGVKTIGYGHACQPSSACNNIAAPITEAQGQDLLKSDLKERVDCVNQNVEVPLNQNQFDALVSFTFNLGCGSLQEIAEPLNKNDFQAATAQMKKYVNDNGKVLDGLVRRRNEEVALFNS